MCVWCVGEGGEGRGGGGEGGQAFKAGFGFSFCWTDGKSTLWNACPYKDTGGPSPVGKKKQ